jgi:hypothetical protein
MSCGTLARFRPRGEALLPRAPRHGQSSRPPNAEKRFRTILVELPLGGEELHPCAPRHGQSARPPDTEKRLRTVLVVLPPAPARVRHVMANLPVHLT